MNTKQKALKEGKRKASRVLLRSSRLLLCTLHKFSQKRGLYSSSLGWWVFDCSVVGSWDLVLGRYTMRCASHAMVLALLAIRGHKSAHSLATGPVMAEPVVWRHSKKKRVGLVKVNHGWFKIWQICWRKRIRIWRKKTEEKKYYLDSIWKRSDWVII